MLDLRRGVDDDELSALCRQFHHKFWSRALKMGGVRGLLEEMTVTQRVVILGHHVQS